MTFNDLPIIKCVYLVVFLVNYNMIKLIVKICSTKKALVLQRIENFFLQIIFLKIIYIKCVYLDAFFIEVWYD